VDTKGRCDLFPARKGFPGFDANTGKSGLSGADRVVIEWNLKNSHRQAPKSDKTGVIPDEVHSSIKKTELMEQEIIRSWVWSTPSSIPLILINVFGWAFYFVPSMIAWTRKHHSLPAIIALNTLLGWTGLGWIGAFVWSLSWPGNTRSQVPASQTDSTPGSDQYE
jgi:hypothetical protein